MIKAKNCEKQEIATHLLRSTKRRFTEFDREFTPGHFRIFSSVLKRVRFDTEADIQGGRRISPLCSMCGLSQTCYMRT